MYLTIPIYVRHLHFKMGKMFWTTLLTFLIGMLSIGLVLGIVAPEIGMLGSGRFKGILGNPNGLGIFLNLCFILWMTLKELKLIELSYRQNLVVGFVIFLSLFWCGSRNGLMSV